MKFLKKQAIDLTATRIFARAVSGYLARRLEIKQRWVARRVRRQGLVFKPMTELQRKLVMANLLKETKG